MNAAKSVLLALGWLACSTSAWASVIDPFISEIHYDNAGTDHDEFVAVTGPSGFDWSGWQVVLYNGANGAEYASEPLQPASALSTGPWTEVVASFDGIQNGPDAIALVSPLGAVAEFLGYEGDVVAVSGPAVGQTSWLLPASEVGVAEGLSLQRQGTLDDWLWGIDAATPGRIYSGKRPKQWLNIAISKSVAIS